jgi:hypothetical protein
VPGRLVGRYRHGGRSHLRSSLTYLATQSISIHACHGSHRAMSILLYSILYPLSLSGDLAVARVKSGGLAPIAAVAAGPR